ncbi:MAG: J domain-containing protein [Pyrinomonadaceae bacterium]
MVNYYKLLKVSPKASRAEIKSAYRRLARKIHPDVNSSAPAASEEFAQIAKAYEILGNPKKRADYDREMLRARMARENGSVFASENPHARRWRQMVYERRYNEIIDRMIADERRESLALQKVIFPTVALFLSTMFVAIFRPTFWTNSPVIGKIIMFSLFVIGSIHLFKRLKGGFERYTSSYENIHDSILDDNEPVQKPYTRFTAVSFLVIGLFLSLGVGLLIGNYLELFITASFPTSYSATLKPELIFYPPIFVLCVDAMHAFASRLEN